MGDSRIWRQVSLHPGDTINCFKIGYVIYRTYDCFSKAMSHSILHVVCHVIGAFVTIPCIVLLSSKILNIVVISI